MTSSNREKAREILGVTLWEGAKSLLGFALAAVFSLTSFAVLARLFRQLSPYKWYFVALGTLGTVWLYLKLSSLFSRLYPRFPRIETHYLVLNRDISFEYRDAYRMVYRKKVRLKALKAGLESYLDKYAWTGKTAPTSVRSAIPAHEVHPTMRRNLWQHYEVRFDHALHKGEVIETEVVWELEDLQGTFQPFISSVIEEPTERLELKLTVPREFGLKQVTCQVSPEIGGKVVISSHALTIDGYGVATWPIPNPRLLYAYEMRWRLPEPVGTAK